MKIFGAILIFISVVPLCGQNEEVPRMQNEYDPSKWPNATLEFSVAGKLKDVFDSGLRPYRFPGLENTNLEIKHLTLQIVLGSGGKLPALKIEVLRIRPFPDGEISTIEGFTPPLTIEQARSIMLKMLSFAAYQRSEESLDSFLSLVKEDPLYFDDPYHGVSHGFGISWNEPGFKTPGGGPRCGFGFRKTRDAAAPLRLQFGIDWGLNRPRRDRGTWRPEPIEAPPGYEDVDMSAPESFGPDSAIDVALAHKHQIEQSSGSKESEDASFSSAGDAGGALPSTNRGEDGASRSWTTFILIVAVTGIIYALARASKDTPSS